MKNSKDNLKKQDIDKDKVQLSQDAKTDQKSKEDRELSDAGAKFNREKHENPVNDPHTQASRINLGKGL